MFTITKAKVNKPKERWELVGLGFVGLVDSIIMICTLGYFVTDLRGWYLFDYLGDY